MNQGEQKPPSGIGVTENIMFEAETFWERHKRRILGGIAIIVVVMAGVGIYFWTQQNQAVNAQKMLAEAKETDDLPKVADEYPGTPAAAEALLKQGEMAAQAGQWEPSANAFRRFLEMYPKHLFAANALMGLGAAHEALGRLPEAEDSYKRVFEQHRQSHRAPEARLALGELLAAQGRIKEARQVLEELVSVYPQSVWVQMARREAQALERKGSGPPAATPNAQQQTHQAAPAAKATPAAAPPKAPSGLAPQPPTNLAPPAPKAAAPQKPATPPKVTQPVTNPAPPAPAAPGPKAAPSQP